MVIIFLRPISHKTGMSLNKWVSKYISTIKIRKIEGSNEKNMGINNLKFLD